MIRRMKPVWALLCAAALCFGMALPYHAAKPGFTNAAVSNADAASENADTAMKNADDATKNAGDAMKNANDATKNADDAMKNAGATTKNADDASKNADATTALAVPPLTVGASAYPLRGKTMHAGDTVGHTPANPAGAVTADALEELLAADPAVMVYVSQQFRVESGVFSSLAQRQDASLTLRRVENGKVVSQLKLSGETLAERTPGETPPADMCMAYSPAATGQMLQRFYTNPAGTYQFGKDGDWGIPAEFAVRVGGSLRDAQNLRVYVYHREKNTMIALPHAAPWIDGNGYLHFRADVSGDFVFSSGPLTLKGR